MFVKITEEELSVRHVFRGEGLKSQERKIEVWSSRIGRDEEGGELVTSSGVAGVRTSFEFGDRGKGGRLLGTGRRKKRAACDEHDNKD